MLCGQLISLSHTYKTEKISSWNGPTVHVCCFMLTRASTKHSLAESIFVSRVRKTAKKIFVSTKNSLAGSLVSRGITVFVWIWEQTAIAFIGRSSMEYDIFVFFENLSRKFRFDWNLTRISDTLLENQNTYLIISRWIRLRWTSVFRPKLYRNSKYTFCVP